MKRPLVVLCALAATVVAAALLLLPGSPATPAHRLLAAACPPGSSAVTPGKDPEMAARAAAGRGTAAKPTCLSRTHPEAPADLYRAAVRAPAHDATSSAGLRPGAHAAAVREASQIARVSAAASSGDGPWAPAGTTPLLANDPLYPQTAPEGFTNLAGRISSFAYDPGRNLVYATVGQGGVWESRDRGAHWTSIGDTLPSQPAASVAYTSAGGGTLVVVTGNNTFGGGTGSYGMGVWYSTDGGGSWRKSAGVPDDALGFKAVVDPNAPQVVYAATGSGLYRSDDAGRTFTNVVLPTGFTNGDPKAAPLAPNCSGETFTRKGCFLANVVTDVVVQGPANAVSTPGRPGAVVAAVGWRAGDKKNPNGGYVESPNNGIYRSANGQPGSFAKVDTAGTLGDQTQIGRVRLGETTGAQQDHRILYAEVADAQAFQNGNEFGLDTPVGPPTGSNTFFRGIYVSTDFGLTWHTLESSSAITADPSTGSSLTGAGCAAQSYCPGVQAWYNEWIAPDPTRTSASGVPTRLLFGLEEVWANDPTASTPLDGSTPVKFKVVGRYFGGTTCQFLSTGLPLCPTNGTDQSSTTLHPDQHAGIFLPDATGGGVTVLAGNDGGAYTQHLGATDEPTSAGWGPGVQSGFHTLLPYDAAISRDGTIVAGLQDNGQDKISPNGTQNEVFGGDAFYTAIDPAQSKTFYEEYTYGQMNVTTDGGSTWTPIHAADSGSEFAMPFRMDATDPNHLIAGGGVDAQSATNTDEQVQETLSGPNTTEPQTGAPASTDWINVFDLGTSNGHPNVASAVATRGAASYVGYCGYCQVLTQTPFASGIATNVGGSKPGAKGSPDGWHVAKAVGLPQRLIQGISIDPSDPKTVYVAMADYDRRWTPAGRLGEDTSKIGAGHIFVSHDAGASFANVSGNLPDAPANDVLVRDGQLIAATDVGVYVSSPLAAGPAPAWRPLGTALPAGLQVLTLMLKPGDENTLVIASQGRGVYTYRFPMSGPVFVAAPVPPPVPTPVGAGGGPKPKPRPGGLGCHAATGSLTGTNLGPLSLGQTLAQARRALSRSAGISYGFVDFCLRPGPGIRVAVPTKRVLASLPRSLRRAVSGRIVLLLSGNRRYALHGVRPGSRLAAAAARLGLRAGRPIRIGLNDWYVTSSGGVLKVRHGVILEVGIADARLVRTRRAARLLL